MVEQAQGLVDRVAELTTSVTIDEVAVVVLRTCGKCKRGLPASEFYRQTARRDGLSFWCKDCQRQQLRDYRNKDRVTWRLKDAAYRKSYWGKDPKRVWAIVACQSAKRRARRDGMDFDITWQTLLPFCVDNCPVLGISLAYERSPGRGIHAGSPTIDRLDNSLGYIISNVIVVSYRVNRIKNDATLQELETVLRFYQRANQYAITKVSNSKVCG
jgi:hypothetical protein